MTINAGSTGHMQFAGTGDEEVRFGRSITQLYITTAGSSISFDGGVNYMTLADTTHVFPHPHVKTIFIQGGTWSGIGIAV